MLIETTKQTQNGYLVNDSISVPNDPTNSDYQAIQEWIANGGIVQPEFTEEELLKNARDKKLKELTDYYNSDECWMYKIQSAALKASITKTAEWFSTKIPAFAGFQFGMYTDAGSIVIVNLPEEKAKILNYKIQGEFSLDLRTKKDELKAIINASSIEYLENLDVKAYLGEVPRIVEFDNI